MSALSEIVDLQITADTVGIQRLGFGVLLILSCNAGFSERVRYYSSLPDIVTDGFVTTSPEYRAARAALSQSPHPTRVAIGRAVGQPTQKYRLDVITVALGRKYEVKAKGQAVTDTTVSYTTLADLAFTTTHASELFTTAAHGEADGAGPYRLSNSGGALPAGVTADTDYWLDVQSATTFKLATTKALALAGTPDVTISGDGTGTHTLRRNQNDVICAQLVQALNAVAGKNYLATQVTGAGETDYVEVTGSAVGNWFSLEQTVIGSLKIAQTHAEPATALATDLDAIQLEQGDWYGLTTLYNSDAYVKAVAAWVESVDAPKIYIADISDSETATLASGGGDTADDLHVLAYARTAVAYHPSPADMLGAAWFGRMLPIEPGDDDWMFKTLSGVNPTTTTSTHNVNLRAKNANWYQTVAGRNITQEGTTCDGDFIDNTRGLDWLEDDMSTGVYGALAGAGKVPFTDQGIALIENQVRASLDRAVSRGILASDPEPVITVPLVADIATSDKALRLLPDVKFSCTLAGAVHKVQIAGTVSV